MSVQKKNEKNLDENSINIVNGIFFDTITSKSGQVYNRVALNTLLLTILRGKPDVIHYATKTYYRFDVKRRTVI